MKKFVFLLSIVCLFALSAFAQTPNFSGEWTLDKSKSKLDERQTASIESQTLKAEQTDKEIKVTVDTKRNAPPQGGGGQGGGMGGGRGMMNFGGGGTYTLDGKEVIVEQETQMGKVPVKYKGEIKDGKLKLQTIRTLNTQMGEVTITSKETWELSADGKTLTVKRENETPRGTMSSESVYTKKS